MKSHLMRAASVALLLLVASGASPAQAQRYDGGGVLKFGVFGQGTFQNFDVIQPLSGSATANGLTAGLSFGFDVHYPGGWLLGLEVDGSFGDARGSTQGINFGFDYLATLRGRFGVYTRPDLLLYGTAGLAFLGVEVQDVGSTDKAAETLTGLTIGVGAEYDWHHVLLFSEYLYTGYGARSFSINDIRHQIEPDAHLLRFGIKFKTGHDYDHGVPRGHGDRYEPLK